MTARNGLRPITAKPQKVGLIIRLKKWRKHHHDREGKKKKVCLWAQEIKKRNRKEERSIETSKAESYLRKCFSPVLPSDPLHWEPKHVLTWIQHLSQQHHFVVDGSLFLMNGKALCLMSLYGFRFRSPDGGAVLHADLKQKIFKQILSVYSDTSTSFADAKNLN